MEVVVVFVIVVGLIGAGAAGWATNVRREVTAREKALVEERAALERQMRQRETLLEQRDAAFRQGNVSGRKWLAACIAEWRQSIDASRENYLRSKPHPGEKSADVVRVIRTEKRALQTELKFLQYQLTSYEESLLSKTALTRHNLAGMPELVPAKSAKRRHRRPQ